MGDPISNGFNAHENEITCTFATEYAGTKHTIALVRTLSLKLQYAKCISRSIIRKSDLSPLTKTKINFLNKLNDQICSSYAFNAFT